MRCKLTLRRDDGRIAFTSRHLPKCYIISPERQYYIDDMLHRKMGGGCDAYAA